MSLDGNNLQIFQYFWYKLLVQNVIIKYHSILHLTSQNQANTYSVDAHKYAPKNSVLPVYLTAVIIDSLQ